MSGVPTEVIRLRGGKRGAMERVSFSPQGGNEQSVICDDAAALFPYMEVFNAELKDR